MPRHYPNIYTVAGFSADPNIVEFIRQHIALFNAAAATHPTTFAMAGSFTTFALAGSFDAIRLDQNGTELQKLIAAKFITPRQTAITIKKWRIEFIRNLNQSLYNNFRKVQKSLEEKNAMVSRLFLVLSYVLNISWFNKR